VKHLHWRQHYSNVSEIALNPEQKRRAGTWVNFAPPALVSADQFLDRFKRSWAGKIWNIYSEPAVHLDHKSIAIETS